MVVCVNLGGNTIIRISFTFNNYNKYYEDKYEYQNILNYLKNILYKTVK